MIRTDRWDRFEKLHQIWRTGNEAGPKDLPTLDGLRTWRISFPAAAILGKTNVLCLFCAFNCGRADVIYVHDAQPRRVTLVDSHRLAMAAMRQLYPSHWTYWCGDYHEYLSGAAPAGFDLVVADSGRPFCNEVAIDCLPGTARLSAPRFTFIVNYWPETVAQLGANVDDLAGLSRALSERAGVAARFREMHQRGQPDLYWAVIDVQR
jgi:hypothetical protein